VRSCSSPICVSIPHPRLEHLRDNLPQHHLRPPALRPGRLFRCRLCKRPWKCSSGRLNGIRRARTPCVH
jgi:hypothetical protein